MKNKDMNKNEMSAIVDAFLIECITNDDVNNFDCFKDGPDANWKFYKVVGGRYKKHSFTVRFSIFFNGRVEIEIRTKSEEAKKFINSFNIYDNE